MKEWHVPVGADFTTGREALAKLRAQLDQHDERGRVQDLAVDARPAG